MIKELYIYSILAIGFILPNASYSQDLRQDEETERVWYLFVDEFENFIDIAKEAQSDGQLKVSEPEDVAIVEDLIERGRRMAHIYFYEINPEIKPRVDTYLNKRLTENDDIKNFFILIGNAFYTHAEFLLQKQKEKNAKIQRWSTIGGTLVGLGSGIGILYFKPNAVKGAFRATVLIVGLTVGGAAIGYGGSLAATTYVLAASPGVETAEAFLARYPAGEDFLDDLYNVNDDLRMGLIDLEESEG